MGRLAFEHRTNPRVSLFQPILIEGAVATVTSQAADLSVGGMFIDHPTLPFVERDLITVRFSLMPQDTPVISEASVNYMQPGIGMGIRFLNIDLGDRDRIAAFVDRTLHRPVLQGQLHLRKSARVSISVSVRVRAMQPDGVEIDEAAQIVTLSKHGACVVVSSRMDVGAKLLVATSNGREFRSSVVWVGAPSGGKESQVGIQCRGLAQSLGFQFP
jgi:PilZ domain-containing protein